MLNAQYVVALRNGQNERKALCNLRQGVIEYVIPLVSLREKENTAEASETLSKQTENFINDWHGAWLADISRYPGDDNAFAQHMNSPHSGFENKLSFFRQLVTRCPKAIPVIGFSSSDPVRDVVQQALKIADVTDQSLVIRVEGFSPESRERLINILNALPDLTRVSVILDLQSISSALSSARVQALGQWVKDLVAYGVPQVVPLSTSYPDSITRTKGIWMPSHDLAWQRILNTMLGDQIQITYGDYGATNPLASIEYIPGMRVIPTAGYYAEESWFVVKTGGSQEFAIFGDIARLIQALPEYHGDSFCWGTEQIARIARSEGGNGSNAYWNGVRINQHISAMLTDIQNGAMAGSSDTEDGEDLF